MTDLCVDNADDPSERSPERAMGFGQIQLPVRFEGRDRIIDIGPGLLIEPILALIATEHGLLLEELIVVRDGDDEPADLAYPIHEGLHSRRLHVHRRHPVAVTVRYQAGAHSRDFRRHVPLERVLDWAICEFAIDPAMAGEFELTRAGNTEELPLNEHIGHLAGKSDCLQLDLVRGDIANGGSDA